ncbi:SOH1-domain-containing protein [Metschnikowia bicuspidata]|uniref:Mediator of RNA polymerase II transcription subunit 31 n=1 Tax=Metschnikowia bicuspidata TaxID=27322 RepID=A0A4P9ZJK0_9ASCO|nr:SOH1-domain-containing protein [Metschnikowia bicuspidata]
MDELPTRWEIELEFVQSLANIQYVNYLAQNDYLTDPAFIAYLEYLTYWKDAKYARYLVYPNCLHILTLLQNEEFRKNVVNPEFINALMNDMVKRWQQPNVAVNQ